MDNQLLRETQFLAKKYGVRPHRPAGQNFLCEQKIIQQIIETAEIKKDDLILEIGAGFGFMTRQLAEKGKKVYAVELDKRLAKCLHDIQKNYKNLAVINNDIFKVRLDELFEDKKYKLVSNLPFNITSLVLRNFLSVNPKPESITLVVQNEIADRVTAAPGQLNLLALSVQAYAQVEKVAKISHDNFWPEPIVDSSIVKITNISQNIPDIEDDKAFFRLLKAGFSAKRKKLINSLASGMGLDKANTSKILSKANISADLRAQDLSLAQWKKLYQIINL